MTNIQRVQQAFLDALGIKPGDHCRRITIEIAHDDFPLVTIEREIWDEVGETLARTIRHYKLVEPDVVQAGTGGSCDARTTAGVNWWKLTE